VLTGGEQDLGAASGLIVPSSWTALIASPETISPPVPAMVAR
jgi:hypothetical protein